MGNCLVTKLKGTVNNPELERIGERRWYADAAQTSTGRKFVAVSGGSITLISDEGLLVDAQGNHVDRFLSNQDARWSGATHLRIQNAYYVKDIYYMPIDPRILDIMYNLELAYITPIQGSKIEDLAKISKSIVRFSIFRNKHVFEPFDDTKLAFLSELTNLDIFQISDDSGAGAIGYEFSLSSLGLYLPTSLTKLVVQSRGAKGSIEGFVQARRAVEETGSLAVTIGSNSPVTFQGKVTSGSNATLSWTATTITWNGTTIDA